MGRTVCRGKCDCQHIFLNVTNENDLGWTIGKTWGVRYWQPGTDRGGLFFIKKQEVKSRTAIGPNVVIKSDRPAKKRKLADCHAHPSRSLTNQADSSLKPT